MTRKDVEEWINELGVPEEEKRSNGGRIPDTTTNYGSWLRKHDPIAFNVTFNEWSREEEYQK